MASPSLARRRRRYATSELKHRARALAQEHGLPLLPGRLLADIAQAQAETTRISLPVMDARAPPVAALDVQLRRGFSELDDAFATVLSAGR